MIGPHRAKVDPEQSVEDADRISSGKPRTDVGIEDTIALM
ncbi:hypothetical protein PAMC26577_35300 [Caballeronia sordidicola]|uniref:Uncharacterized protein n=1 Tax=Caballeronia sordidicola TaxID=196367 RepID=A0A2C9XUZ5_CABSO|nr:hypothetical protein PAMC26577_35300 [Caballeronia sordidicola]